MLPETAVRDLVALAVAGAAILGTGIFSLMGGIRGRWNRLILRLGTILGAAAVALVVSGPAAAGMAAGAVAVPLLLAAALRSSRFHSFLQFLGRPRAQAVCLTAAGAALLVGSVARFDAVDESAMTADMDFVLRVTWKPEVLPVAAATTDAGRPIIAWEAVDPRPASAVLAAERDVLGSTGFAAPGICRGPASDRCNCHGWVFTGGRYWLTPQDVEHILVDNGYTPVSGARPGDLVVYRGGGVICHTSIVRSAESALGILVEGKWGWMGVFVHPAGQSGYGQEYTFYRSSRAGHVLNGLNEP